MQKVAVISIAVLLLAGCSAAQLTSSGAKVKFVGQQPSSECQSLGQVVGEQSTWLSGQGGDSGSMRGAANDLRNKAAAMGGNVIFGVNSPTETLWSQFVPTDSKMVGQVYRCPE